jgi:hypothetical protein
MSYVLVSKLPEYVVDYIKLFTGEGCWRNGKYINIHKFLKNDLRYTMLTKMPKVRQLKLSMSHPTKIGSVWYKYPNNKYVVINKGFGDFWTGHQYNEGYFCEIFYNNERIVYYLG